MLPRRSWAFAAQLIPRKRGHVLLFDALKLIEATHPKVQLIVFGRGPLSDVLPAEAVQRADWGQIAWCLYPR